MSIRKMISVLLVLSQLLGFDLGFAQDHQTPSPEVLLLEQAIALDGTAMQKDQLEAQFQNAVTNYLATAQSQGQQARLGDALVELGIYTPTQAQSFLADAQKAFSHLLETAKKQAGATEFKSVLASEISRLVATHPAGAQFSACDVGESSMAIGLIAPIALTAASYVVGGAGACNGIPNCTTDANPNLAQNLIYAAGGVALLAFTVMFIAIQFTPQDGC